MDKRTLAICLTNRAQCHIKHEEFGKSFRISLSLICQVRLLKMPQKRWSLILRITRCFLFLDLELMEGIFSTGDGEYGNREAENRVERF